MILLFKVGEAMKLMNKCPLNLMRKVCFNKDYSIILNIPQTKKNTQLIKIRVWAGSTKKENRLKAK